MNDKTDFSYTFNVGPTVPQEQDTQLMAFDTCKVYRLPDNKLLVRNPRNGRSSVVTPQVLAALKSCEAFRTADEHAERIVARSPAMKSRTAEIRKVLKTTLQDGLMVSADGFCASLARAGGDAGDRPAPDAADAVVVVITCERPAALRRLLDSMRGHCDPKSYGALYVIDDSRSAARIAENREIVASFRNAVTDKAIYFGREQQSALIERIIRHAPECETGLRFLADPARWADHFTAGLARTHALLLSAGRRAVVLDDDVLCTAYEPAVRQGGVAISNAPREAEFFGRDGEWPSFGVRADPDPLKAHLDCIGLDIAGALDRLGAGVADPSALAGASMEEIGSMHAASPVLVTQNGTLGDPGTNDNSWLAELGGESQARLLRSPESVDNAIRNSNVWLGRARPHLLSRANMSAVTGLDNRRLLPPYFPFYRGEDRLFGNMLSHLFPDAVVVDLPLAVPHLPPQPRERSADRTDFGIFDNFPRFFLEWPLLQKELCTASSAAARLAQLAQSFVNLGDSSHARLAEYYRDERTQFGCSSLEMLRKALARAGNAPDNWKEFLERGLRKVDEDLVASLEDLPVRGSPAGIEGRELTRWWREAWTEFGNALQAWPAIRDAVAECGVEHGQD